MLPGSEANQTLSVDFKTNQQSLEQVIAALNKQKQSVKEFVSTQQEVTKVAAESSKVQVTAAKEQAKATIESSEKSQQSIRQLLHSYRDLTLQGRLLREVGSTALMGANAILRPLTAAADEYVKKYGQLEKTSRDFLQAQNAQQNATVSLGRVAAQALTPFMNQTTAFMQRVADFAAAHPELIQAAVGAATGLAAGAGALVAAGTAITTIARTAELMKVAFSGQGLLGAITNVVGPLVAMAAAAKLTEVGLNKIGEATGNESLAHFQLADALKTARQLIAGTALILTEAFILAKEAWEGLQKQIQAIWTLLGASLQKVLLDIADATSRFIFDIFNFLAQLHIISQGDFEKASAARTSTLTTINTARDDNNKKLTDAVLQLSKGITITRSSDDMKFLKDAADAFSKFADTGALGPTGDKIAKGIDSIVSFFTGKGGTASVPAAATSGPDLAMAFIDRQKKITQSEKQYNLELISLEYSRTQETLKIARERNAQLAQEDADIANARKVAIDNFAAENAKALQAHNFEELQIVEKQRFERQKQLREQEQNLTELAAAGDVSSFVKAQKQNLFQQQQQTIQDNFDKQQREEKFQEDQRVRTADFARQQVETEKQNAIRRQQELAQFKREDNERKIAADNQLNALKLKHSQELQLINQEFAVQVAQMANNYANLNTIQANYYAEMESEAANFVAVNKSYLQSLYNMTIPTATNQAVVTPTAQPSTSGGTSLLQQGANLVSSIFGNLFGGSHALGGRIPRDGMIWAHAGERMLRHNEDAPRVNVTIHATVGDVASKSFVEQMAGQVLDAVHQGLQGAPT